MARAFKTITIIGVGLIGGSLGLAVKRRVKGATVTGFDAPQVLRKALRRGAIDTAATNLATAVSGADLVILACPTKKILSLLPAVARSVSPHTLVTDVGSVKAAIVRRASIFFPNGNFIGGHPMAGIELSGIEAAHPLLFENAVYVLTPARFSAKRVGGSLAWAPQRHVKRLSDFLHTLGARVMVLDAQTHDSVAAAVSHVPQLTAVALMNVAGARHPQARKYLQLAAGGFRDLTRIASSRYDVWQDILQLNNSEIERALALMTRELQRYRARLRKRNNRPLQSDFTRARKLRNAIPRTMKGFLHSLSDVYVFVQDKPGVLAIMTGALAKAKINIKDMELLKIREGSGGTFRLAFDSADVAGKAARILRKKGFEVEE